MLKVLLVDDDYAQRSYLENVIDWGSEDCVIAGEASDGREALECVDRLKPDLVLLDVHMPSMDGLEFLKKISEGDCQVQVVIVSGFDEFEYAREAMKYGARNYILKPVNENELLGVIRKTKQEIAEKQKVKEKLLIDLVSGKIDSTETLNALKHSRPRYGRLVTNTMELIDKNYTDVNLSLESIAASLFVHPVYLSSTFKRETQQTLTEYIIGCRMKKAMELIGSAHGHKSLQDIAMKVGYEDPYYFSKAFKKFYGFTPAEAIKR